MYVYRHIYIHISHIYIYMLRGCRLPGFVVSLFFLGSWVPALLGLYGRLYIIYFIMSCNTYLRSHISRSLIYDISYHLFTFGRISHPLHHIQYLVKDVYIHIYKYVYILYTRSYIIFAYAYTHIYIYIYT